MRGHHQTFTHGDRNNSTATLFVTRFSAEANEHYLRRLFSAYGHVKNVELDSQQMFARITFPSTDDADTAVAVLHLRYETVPGVTLVVLYDKQSQKVSPYGRQVGAAFVKALNEKTDPQPIPLTQFDPDSERGEVPAPPEPTAAFFAGNMNPVNPAMALNGGGGGWGMPMGMHHHHHHHHHHGGAMFPHGMFHHHHHHHQHQHHAAMGGMGFPQGGFQQQGVGGGFMPNSNNNNNYYRGGGGGGRGNNRRF